MTGKIITRNSQSVRSVGVKKRLCIIFQIAHNVGRMQSRRKRKNRVGLIWVRWRKSKSGIGSFVLDGRVKGGVAVSRRLR